MSLNKVVPTKANLMKMKSSLEFARKGHELLDKKHTVLIQEMLKLNSKAAKIQVDIENDFLKSFQSFKEATLTMGSGNIEELAYSMKLEPEYNILFHSVMGVEIPDIKYEKEELSLEYSFYKTTTAYDEANKNMRNMRYLIYELAEIQTAVFKLAEEIKKTQKRVNALGKIQIPKYEEIVKEIEETLAEKEREDFFRLKKVKDLKEKKLNE